MTENPPTLRRIQAIHESMIELGTLPGDSSSLAIWLSAEIELLDQLRAILACAAHMPFFRMRVCKPRKKYSKHRSALNRLRSICCATAIIDRQRGA